MSDEKTEKPTPRRLAEIRKKGDVPLSAEMSTAVGLLAGIYLLSSRLPILMRSLAEVMRYDLGHSGEIELTTSSLMQTGRTLVGTAFNDIMPFILVLGAVGMVVTIIQTRGLITMDKLKPSFSHLNPLSGLKRLFSTQTLIELAKGSVKIALLVLVLYSTMQGAPKALALASASSIQNGLTMLGDRIQEVGRQGAMVLLAAAVVDVITVWRKYRQKTMMSRHEITEEMKNSEGQPLIRAKIRQMQRRWSRQRMMQQLTQADVVVTNPTHLAIALRYDSKTMNAPTVVAKGKGLIAEQIMKKARQLRIPLVQNIPLAHALIHVELDEAIPVNLYGAVAEVLAFVYRLRKQGGAR